MPSQAATNASGHATTRGHSAFTTATTIARIDILTSSPASAAPSGRRLVSAADSALPMLTAPAATRPALPDAARFASRGSAASALRTRWRRVSTISVDANSGLLPGPFTHRTVKEYFASGNAPKKVDNTKVGVAIDKATGKLWQDGCLGPKVTKGFLDFSNVDAGWPQWQKYDRGWAKRAARGVGVRGGPKGTPTAYFGFGGFFPFGATWGAPFPPSKMCPIGGPQPTPGPTESPLPSGTLPAAPEPTKKPRYRRTFVLTD